MKLEGGDGEGLEVERDKEEERENIPEIRLSQGSTPSGLLCPASSHLLGFSECPSVVEYFVTLIQSSTIWERESILKTCLH